MAEITVKVSVAFRWWVKPYIRIMGMIGKMGIALNFDQIEDVILNAGTVCEANGRSLPLTNAKSPMPQVKPPKRRGN